MQKAEPAVKSDEERPETVAATEEEEEQTKTEERTDEEDHAKMPEHPGRDSDSGDSDEDQEA